eukprot:2751609-Prymnesium_polylepis.2
MGGAGAEPRAIFCTAVWVSPIARPPPSSLNLWRGSERGVNARGWVKQCSCVRFTRPAEEAAGQLHVQQHAARRGAECDMVHTSLPRQ